jgi:hypothetical protein
VFILCFFLTGSLGFWLGVYYRWRGRFCCFAEFSKVVGLKMSDQGDIWGDPKGKSISRGEKRRMEAEARGPRFSGASGSNNDGTKPGEECKAALFQALYEWFKETPLTNLNRNYLALGANVGKEAFVGRMRRLLWAACGGFLKTPFLERSGTRRNGRVATPNGWRTSLWTRCTTYHQFLTSIGNFRRCQ